jgi:DNA repair exonuclease SbcCD ATPase subunit
MKKCPVCNTIVENHVTSCSTCHTSFVDEASGHPILNESVSSTEITALRNEAANLHEQIAKANHTLDLINAETERIRTQSQAELTAYITEAKSAIETAELAEKARVHAVEELNRISAELMKRKKNSQDQLDQLNLQQDMIRETAQKETVSLSQDLQELLDMIHSAELAREEISNEVMQLTKQSETLSEDVSKVLELRREYDKLNADLAARERLLGFARKEIEEEKTRLLAEAKDRESILVEARNAAQIAVERVLVMADERSQILTKETLREYEDVSAKRDHAREELSLAQEDLNHINEMRELAQSEYDQFMRTTYSGRIYDLKRAKNTNSEGA